MTSTSLTIPRRPLTDISSRAWEHPADRAALAAMRAIPGFDEIVKKLFGMLGERGVRLAFQSDAVRVSARQFPHLHRLWLQVHETLDSPDEYQLYIAQSPATSAGAFGMDKPWVMLLSGSLDLLEDEEIEFVMGHELGHVLSGHALYHTMMVLLAGFALRGFPLLGLAAMPVLLALKEWYRKSELSADRAGLLTCQRPDAAMNTMMRLAGGGRPEQMNLAEFLIQAEEYRHLDGFLDQVFRVMNTLDRIHPALVLRAALIRDWIEAGEYDRIMRGEYPKRGDQGPGWTDDVATGLRFYTSGMTDFADRAAERAGSAAERAGSAARGMREAFERGFKGGDKGSDPGAGTDAAASTEPSPAADPPPSTGG